MLALKIVRIVQIEYPENALNGDELLK